MKELVGTFNQKKALVGAFSVIVKTGYGTDGALHSITRDQRIMNPTPTNICTFHANKETSASFTFAETPRENQQQVNNVQRKYFGVDKLFLCICGAN